jgi:hypothetical protein
MSEPTNREATPASVTGRRRRFTGAHPYPALPQSRLPLLRGVLWITWAAFLALLDALRGLLPGRRRWSGDSAAAVESHSRAVSRPPRVPSLTPTG